MRFTTLESGINTADLLPKWEKLQEVAQVVDHKLYMNMLRGIFSWDNPADHDAVKLRLITALAAI